VVAARALAATLAAGLLGAAPNVGAHPLHTSLTTLAYDGAARQVVATVRVFAADLDQALARAVPHAAAASDGDRFAYVRRGLGLWDDTGRPLPLAWCGARRTSDVVWLCVRAPASGLAGVRVRNQLLVELFADQVNIVSAQDGARHISLLFTRGAKAKPVR